MGLVRLYVASENQKQTQIPGTSCRLPEGRGLEGRVKGVELKIKIISENHFMERMFLVKHVLLAVWGWKSGSHDLFRDLLTRGRLCIYLREPARSCFAYAQPWMYVCRSKR